MIAKVRRIMIFLLKKGRFARNSHPPDLRKLLLRNSVVSQGAFERSELEDRKIEVRKGYESIIICKCKNKTCPVALVRGSTLWGGKVRFLGVYLRRKSAKAGIPLRPRNGKAQ